MMINTALDADIFCAKYVGDGRAAADPLVRETVNECQQILVTEGDWTGLVQKIRMQVSNNSFALPYNIETVLKVYHDDGHHHSPSRVWSMGYELLDGGPGPLRGEYDHEWVDLIDLGDNWPIMFPIGNTKRPLIALSTHADDAGVNMLIRGRDDLSMDISPVTPGENVMIQQWKGGVEGTLTTTGIAPTTNSFVEIDLVKKPVTKGYVSLFAYQSSDHAMWFLAKYHPQQTQPAFRRYKLSGRDSAVVDDSLVMLVKMRYVPVVDDTDVLTIQNLPALRVMCQSVHARNMGDTGNALTKQADAIRMLDQQLKSAHPETNEFDVQMTNSFGDLPRLF